MKYIAIVVLSVFSVVPLLCIDATASTTIVQSGVVTRVVDGDTIWVTTEPLQPPLKVRLQGIDAPEICQAGGQQARDALSGRLSGQRVTLTSRARDDYDRSVATVYLNGQDINRWMVANGHAWVYTFRSKKGAYADEFAKAQVAGRGVFSAAQAQEPRLFRKAHGSCYAPSYKKSSAF